MATNKLAYLRPLPEGPPVRPSDLWPIVAVPSNDVEELRPTTVFVRPDLEEAAPDPTPAPDAASAVAPTHEVTEKISPRTTSEQEWAELEAIGLGRRRAPRVGLQKLLVSAYRLLGFAILTAIVIALVGYIATSLFYMTSTSWVVPTIISPTDEKVVALRSELAKQQNERDRIAQELADAERAIAVEQDYQRRFAAAIATDRADRRSALRRTRALAGAAKHTRAEIRASTRAFALDSAARMSEQYSAGMIDRHDMLDGKHQLAQLTSANLSLAERQATFETAAAELARHAGALDALLSDRDAPLSFEVLEIKRRFEASKLALANATALRDTLGASLARHDEMLAGLRSSTYLRAVDDGATVALVPYANLSHATAGAEVYACRLEMVVCRSVGKVVQLLPGEIQLHHPHSESLVRGQMVELSLATDAGHADVLFIGGKPLGL